MTYSIERVKYPDGTIVVKHTSADGDYWCKWIVAPTEELAFLHSSGPYYSGPGRSFAHPAYRIDHPKKIVLKQRGGLDI